MYKVVLFFTLCIVLTACGYEENNSETTTEETSGQAELVCEEAIPGADEIPNFSVFLVVGESKVKVANVNACEPIAPANYGQYQIPVEAVSAAGGWYAGFGDYLYATEEEGKIVVFQGSMDEMQETDNYGYAPIAEYENGSLNLLLQEE